MQSGNEKRGARSGAGVMGFELWQIGVLAFLLLMLLGVGVAFGLLSRRRGLLPAPEGQTYEQPTLAPSPTAMSGTEEAAAGGTGTPVATAAPATDPTALPTLPAPCPPAAWQRQPVPSDAELIAFIDGMSLQDKIGQMLMVGFHGQSIAGSPELSTMVGGYRVGGLVLLEANAHDPRQLTALTSELQQLARSSGAGIPLFISLNQEGGIVVRITEGVTEFPGPMALAATGEPAYACAAGALTARELRAMGLNMNLAPVLDVNDEPYNPVIGTRSFGEDPQAAAEYGRLMVRGIQENGVVAVAKHFPGHGGVDVDSHGALPVIEAPLEELLEEDLLPFRAAIDEGVDGIMTAHIAIQALDPTGTPATLSGNILTGLLRERFGYDGLIMTDSLGMAGASAGRGQSVAAVEAAKAGADILLSTTPMQAHVDILQALESAVQRGELPEERIDASVLRILRMKHAYGLFEPASPEAWAALDLPAHQAEADRIAREAVTLVQSGAAPVPLPEAPQRLLVISPDQLPPAAGGQSTLFGEQLAAAGHEVTEYIVNLNASDSRAFVHTGALQQASAHDVIVFGEWELIKRYINWDDTWQRDFMVQLQAVGRPLIVVAWHNPAAALLAPEQATVVTAYGNARSQVSAITALLVGEQEPVGRMPMTLP